MKQKYFYHEHLADYAMMKAEGLMSRGELYGDVNFSDFSSKAFLAETLPRLDVNAGARVLELGCGTGSGACFLAELGYQVHGIDVIPDAIDKAREIAAERGLDIKYEVIDVCDLPREGKPYDLIIDSYCSQGIVTDEDRAAMFTGVKARLAPHGYFLMSCSVFEPHREAPEMRIADELTGKVYTAFDGSDLWDGDTETCYNRFRIDPLRPDIGPEEYEGDDSCQRSLVHPPASLSDSRQSPHGARESWIRRPRTEWRSNRERNLHPSRRRLTTQGHRGSCGA